ncbi:kelch repeat-containing protein [Leptospira sp. GIMC2001]|uniref:kelch repeat-containing protein n=1 Tax=Leptospira sp. GIMC2001 TaxID=1513297 RepID=UPI0023490EE9|nr:kelch repeat-containing protein [Leptospira sp. GIMC2001]WCL48101.1 hypothetical protein O4O04_12335 [Leptospira sp. GIMC2001]
MQNWRFIVLIFILANCNIINPSDDEDPFDLLFQLSIIEIYSRPDSREIQIVDIASRSYYPISKRLDVALRGMKSLKLKDGSILSVGGLGGGSIQKSVLRINSDWNDFAYLNNTSAPRVNHTLTEIENGDVVIIGGTKREDEVDMKIVEKFIFATNEIRSIGSLLFERSLHQSFLLDEKNILIIGGIDSKSRKPIAEIELFNLDSGASSVVGNMLFPRSLGNAVRLNDQIFLLGGSNDDAGEIEIFNKVEQISIGTWVSVELASLPLNLDTLNGQLNGSKLEMIGGFTNGNVRNNRIIRYDLITGESSVSNPFLAYTNPSCIFQFDNRNFYIFGVNGNRLSNTIQEYNTESESDVEFLALREGRQFSSCVSLGNGKIAIIGGW